MSEKHTNFNHHEWKENWTTYEGVDRMSGLECECGRYLVVCEFEQIMNFLCANNIAPSNLEDYTVGTKKP